MQVATYKQNENNFYIDNEPSLNATSTLLFTIYTFKLHMSRFAHRCYSLHIIIVVIICSDNNFFL